MVKRDPDHHLMPCTQDLNADPSFNLTANKPPPLQGRDAVLWELSDTQKVLDI